MTSLAAAYSATGSAWQSGPGRIYDRLARVAVEGLPVSLRGARVLDVGAGTGAATRAAITAGAADVCAVDSALGMLAHDAPNRPPAVAADALALPFPPSVFDAAVAAFSLNHLDDPASGLREMVRVTRPGGVVVVASYAADDGHPVKDAVEAALAERGWEPEPWYRAVRKAVRSLATVEGCTAAAEAAGLSGAVTEAVRVEFPDLGAADLVAWRLGMAQHAPFVSGLCAEARRAVGDEALARLGDDPPPLARSILVLHAFSG